MGMKMSCSFCGKAQEDSEKLIASPSGTSFICKECIMITLEIIKEDEVETYSRKVKVRTPKEIKNLLDKEVIGQDYAKVKIAIAVYNHILRINKSVKIDKTNILLQGPTGSGKTFIVQNLAKMLDVPYATVSATTLTENGYVGDDVESVFLKLLQAADFDKKKAQRGIIFIDEVDKLAKKVMHGASKDPTGEGVQQALLTMIEGTKIDVPPQGGRKFPYQENISMNTKDILFIFGGAFVGIEDIKKGEILKTQHLVEYGMIPEFMGRIPTVVELRGLNEIDLSRIINHGKNSMLEQYKKFFKYHNTEITISKSGKNKIAELALSFNTGARSLKTVVEKILEQYIYNIDKYKDQKIVINAEDVTEKFFDNSLKFVKGVK